MVPDTSLLKKLVPPTRVLIWAHTAPLQLSTPGLATMDYLLDGLAIGHIKAHPERPSHDVLFSHLHYGKALWVGFADVKHVTPPKFLAALKAVLPSDALSQAAVVQSAALPSEWEKALRELFQQIDHHALS